MARQLVLAAGVGAGTGVAPVTGFRAGAWLVHAAVIAYFRARDWATRQDMESAE